jgi:hypothetical protein
VRDLYASNPLADLDLSFIVSDPLSGAAIRLTAAVDDEGNPMYVREARLTAAVDDEGNPMYVREASLAPELRQAGQHAPAQNAAGSAGRAKPLANPSKTCDPL